MVLILVILKTLKLFFKNGNEDIDTEFQGLNVLSICQKKYNNAKRKTCRNYV